MNGKPANGKPANRKPEKPPRKGPNNNTIKATIKAKIIKSIKNAQKANIIKDLQDNLPIVNYDDAMKMIKEAPVKESVIDKTIYNDYDIEAAYGENLVSLTNYEKFIGISMQEPTNANRARLAAAEAANRARLAAVEAALKNEHLGLQKIELNDLDSRKNAELKKINKKIYFFKSTAKRSQNKKDIINKYARKKAEIIKKLQSEYEEEVETRRQKAETRKKEIKNNERKSVNRFERQLKERSKADIEARSKADIEARSKAEAEKEARLKADIAYIQTLLKQNHLYPQEIPEVIQKLMKLSDIYYTEIEYNYPNIKDTYTQFLGKLNKRQRGELIEPSAHYIRDIIKFYIKRKYIDDRKMYDYQMTYSDYISSSMYRPVKPSEDWN